ncbi:MAG: ATP-binding protein, partial [Acetobacterium sp.]|nr:ATP-binding protein [Acetobacterium sp.]
AQIEVKDNGPGMSEEICKRIFDPFFTTKEIGVGTGLGLSVAYALVVNNHRGIISVDSEPDRGATFTISLPFCTKDAA